MYQYYTIMLLNYSKYDEFAVNWGEGVNHILSHNFTFKEKSNQPLIYKNNLQNQPLQIHKLYLLKKNYQYLIPEIQKNLEFLLHQHHGYYQQFQYFDLNLK